MSKNLIIKQCENCKTVVKVIKEEGSKLFCCEKQMQELSPNSVDASYEKHIPNYEIKGDKISVKVNHVMENDHYIEWISMCSDNKEFTVYFKPGDVAMVEFEYIPGAILYAYCNKHALWKKEVE